MCLTSGAYGSITAKRMEVGGGWNKVNCLAVWNNSFAPELAWPDVHDSTPNQFSAVSGHPLTRGHTVGGLGGPK